MPKVKENLESKTSRVTYKGVPIWLSADFSKEISQARRGWQEIIQSDEKQGPTA